MAGSRLASPGKETYLSTMQREPLPQYATDDQIETLVATFYARIRRDAVLGPIFLAAIGEDWTAHLKTMCDFWSSIICCTRIDLYIDICLCIIWYFFK